MKKNIPKTVLTARVEEAFKKQFSEEAAQCDMTLSSYTEYCLRNYNSVLHDLQISNENNDSLRNKVNSLVSENWELNSENEKTSAHNEQLGAAKQTVLTALKFERERAEFLSNQVNTLESQNQEQAIQIQDLGETIEIFAEHQEDANTQIVRLKAEKLLLINQVRQLKEEKDALYKTYEKSCDARDRLRTVLNSRLPIALLPEEIEKVKASLAELKERHKECTEGELLALSLATVVTNEHSMFFMYDLNEFKNKNPHFLISKQLQ